MRFIDNLTPLCRRCIVQFILIAITPIAFILRFCGVRFLGTGLEHRFGHLIIEPYYAAILRKSEPRQYKFLVLTYDPRNVANAAVIAALPDYFVRITQPMFRRLLKAFQRHPICSIDMDAGIRTATGEAGLFQLLADCERPDDFLQHPAWYPATAVDVLRYFGINNRDWYVLMHVRESTTYGSKDAIHDYRNGSILTMIPTIEAITQAGGAVIRIGDASMLPLEVHEGVLDHATLPNKSPDEDLFLYRFARMFIGNTSGPLNLAGVEGIPIVAVNAAPIGASLVFDSRAICVPKIYVRKTTGEEIPFAEIFASPLADIRSTSVFESVDVQLVETSPEEILGAVQEALGWGENACESEWDRHAQMRFKQLFRDGNYSRRSTSTIARIFLQKYAHLLD